MGHVAIHERSRRILLHEGERERKQTNKKNPHHKEARRMTVGQKDCVSMLYITFQRLSVFLLPNGYKMASLAPFDPSKYPPPGQGDLTPSLLDTPPDKKNAARMAKLVICTKDEEPFVIELEEGVTQICMRPLSGIENGTDAVDAFLKGTCASWDRLQPYYIKTPCVGRMSYVLFKVDHPMPSEGFAVSTASLFTGTHHLLLSCAKMKMYYKPEF